MFYSILLFFTVVVAILPSAFTYTSCMDPQLHFTKLTFTCAGLQEMMEWHRPRLKCLVEEGVDVLAIETIPAKVNEYFCYLYDTLCICPCIVA